MKISKDDFILLLGKKKSYLTKPKSFCCEFGKIELEKFVGRNYGIKVKIGDEKFTIVKPSMIDLLKRARRGPQIILPKDASTIVFITGCSPGWKVVDAGTGSGFLAMFLANLGCKVYSYEKRREFYQIAKKNVKEFDFRNIFLKNKDITKGIKEKNVDLITLDMKNPEKVIKHAYKSLKPGGWIAVYSMHIEEVKRVHRELEKYNFSDIKIIETIQREWQSIGGLTRPKTHMLAHTGFLTFARKM